MSEKNKQSPEPETLPADIFKRESIAQAMSRILCEFDRQDVSPAVLNGPWGCGKSVHAQRMMQHIETHYAKTHRCIYWNAATVDFAKEPLPMFVAALSREVQGEKRDEFARNGLALCAGALIGGMTSIASQFSSHWLGVDARQVVADAKQDALDSSAPDALVGSFKQFLDVSTQEEKRMEAAARLVELAGEGKELIIIIDELDRCRPNFALSLLESIKHLFCRTHCRFLLVMNKVSMVSSIQHLYGLDENQASLYLNKFITQDFSLPSSTHGQYEEEMCPLHYFKILLAEEKYPRTYIDDITDDFITTVFRNNNFQLREIEKLARAMFVLQNNGKRKIDVSRSRYLTLLLCFLAYLIAFYPNLLFEMMSRSVSAQEILSRSKCIVKGDVTKSICCDGKDYLTMIVNATMTRHAEEYQRILNEYLQTHRYDRIEEDLYGFASLLKRVPGR